MMLSSTGKVIKAFGNLVHIQTKDPIRLGGVGFISVNTTTKLKSEIVEINGDVAKLQCFEDISGICVGDAVEFTGDLLEIELGPGLLGSIFDGLQNPLKEIKARYGNFISRGKYFRAINDDKEWEFIPKVEIGDRIIAGMSFGSVKEYSLTHEILLLPNYRGEWTIKHIVRNLKLKIDDEVAVISNGEREVSIKLSQKWAVKQQMCTGNKTKTKDIFYTGLRIIDTLFPVLKGGTFCTPGPFGAGKTVLQHHFTRWAEVDVVIVVACGERAGEITQIVQEMKELQDPRSGRPMIERTVMICNTSSMPTAAREASIYTGITIAEYYMNMGMNVLCLADSTSRWAQALRELSGRLEEMPGEEAFPAYLGSRLAQIYERAGCYIMPSGKSGSITFGGTVSPSGGNFEEPVTQKTLVVVGAFLGLSRERAGARKFPSIDPKISWSKYFDDMCDSHGEKFSEMIKYCIDILRRGEDVAQRIEVVGEDGVAISEYVCFLKSELFDFCFLQQNSFDEEDIYTSRDKRNHMLGMVVSVLMYSPEFKNIDETRNVFVSLRSLCTNLRYLKFMSEEYKRTTKEISVRIES